MISLQYFDVTVIFHDVMSGFIKCSNHYLLVHSSQHPGDHYLPTLQPAGVIPRREKKEEAMLREAGACPVKMGEIEVDKG